MKYNGGMDTYAGMSGSPVWVYTTSGTRVIVGVHTHGGYYFNGGTRLTDPIYKDITAWANDEGIGNNTSTSLTGTSISDSITGTDSRDVVWGLNGNDTINAGSGADLIYGNKGLDFIMGGTGNDIIYGGQNAGTPSGAPLRMRDGVETLIGGAGADIIYGNMGGDRIFGQGDGDTIYGGQDDDTIIGGDGGDRLYGNIGDDLIYGDNLVSSVNAGIDTIDGAAGNDTAVYLSNYFNYSLTRLDDGGISVNSYDILYNIEYIFFKDQIISTDLI